MNFLDWIKKHITVFTFLVTVISATLGFISGLVISYYKVQSRFEVIDNGFDKINFKLDTVQKTMDREFENVYDVLHFQKESIKKIKNTGN